MNASTTVTTIRGMMNVASALPSLLSTDEIDRTTAELLSSVIDADELIFVHLDLAGAGTEVRLGPNLVADPLLSRTLSRFGHTHPAVISYLNPGDDRRPRRTSDVVSNHDWISSPAFQEAFRDRGARFQLSLVTKLHGAVGAGWVLTRSGQDFDSKDLEVAKLVLPFLTTLTEIAAARGHALAPACSTLTAREHEILEQLATGKSARQIAHNLGMTEPTARKHLSHIYAKLGVHDRLSAVLAMRPPNVG